MGMLWAPNINIAQIWGFLVSEIVDLSTIFQSQILIKLSVKPYFRGERRNLGRYLYESNRQIGK